MNRDATWPHGQQPTLAPMTLGANGCPGLLRRIGEMYAYDTSTGQFTRRVRRGRYPVGSVVGSLDREGYVSLVLAGVRFKGHRVAWALTHGAWPDGQVDHINGIKSDNRAENLRAVSAAGNRQNQRRARSDNKTGLQGVRRSNGRYAACIKVAGRVKQFGTFDTPEEAHACAMAAKRAHHPYFAG